MIVVFLLCFFCFVFLLSMVSSSPFFSLDLYSCYISRSTGDEHTLYKMKLNHVNINVHIAYVFISSDYTLINYFSVFFHGNEIVFYT